MASALAGKIDRFWSWFKKGPASVKAPSEGSEDNRLLEIGDALDEVFPGLTLELHQRTKSSCELVFSLVQNRDPAARKKGVVVIEALVAAAPKLKAWRFSAFAASVGWHDAFLPRLDLPNGSRLEVQSMRFEVLKRAPLSVRVYVPAYSTTKARAFSIAVERVLEAGMGERFVLKDLAHLEVGDIEDAPVEALPIQELSKSASTATPGHREEPG